MKMTPSLKLVFISVVLTFASCSNGQDNETSEIDINSLCIDPYVFMEITESIPATVRLVDEGQPFFNGVKRYYEVNAETYIPSIFENSGERIVRIFPIQNKGEEVGSEIKISGKLISCFTGAHGLLTNDYKVFTLIDN